MSLETKIQLFAETIPSQHRITPCDIEGQKLWIKKPEPVRGWKGIYKKLVTSGFEKEVQALLYLNQKGAPAPNVLCSGPDFLATEDVGDTLQSLVINKGAETPESEKEHLLFEAGRALAHLHSLQLYHGRPALRDICWNGECIAFIDYERHTGSKATSWQTSLDILIFVHDISLRIPIQSGLFAKAIDGYLTNDKQSSFQKATEVAYKLRWAIPLIKFIKPIVGRDAAMAIPVLEKLIQLKQAH